MVVAIMSATYLGMGFASAGSRSASMSPDAERIMAAVLVSVVISVALAIRPVQFGVDTITYIRYYDQYCFSSLEGLDFSYRVTFALVNVVQLGSCNSDLLIAAWIFIIVACFALLPDDLHLRLKLSAVALFSMIGMELASNALRQGLSAAVMMLAFAQYNRNKAVGIALAIFSVLLHSSSGLVLVAIIISHFRLRYYLTAFSALAALVLSYSYLNLDISALNRLTGEIDKYSQHDPQDIYIRMLSAAQLFTPLLVVLMTSGWRRASDTKPDNGSVIGWKLALTAAPFMVLPYFGYRYIYGLYLIVLYISREAITDDNRPAFEMVLLANALIVLVWALGSSYVSNIPFFVL
jgi:hypothetical protein